MISYDGDDDASDDIYDDDDDIDDDDDDVGDDVDGTSFVVLYFFTGITTGL
jgi:hypothetical protein